MLESLKKKLGLPDNSSRIGEELEKLRTQIKKIQKDLKQIIPYAREAILMEYQEKSKIREVYITELFKGIEEVAVPIGAINEETGHANHVDLLYVVAVAKYLQCENVFEFGTYLGRTTYYLTFASDNTTVFTLDLPLDQNPQGGKYLGIYFRDTAREKFVKQILCNSKDFDPAPFRKKMNLVFVDGDHSYEGVKNDTEKAYEMLAPGGVIIWHDYAAKTMDIVQFFAEFTQRQPLFRIKNTCLLLHIDGIDPLSYTPYERPKSKKKLKEAGMLGK